LEISPRHLKLHAELSEASARFLEFVAEHPEYAISESFGAPEVGDDDPYGHSFQPWPTFTSRRYNREATANVAELVRLMRRLVHRVFDGRPELFGEIYGFGAEVQKALSFAVGRGPTVEGLAARPDFVRTAEGLRCLECNLAPTLGGWNVADFAEAYLDMPSIAHFLSEAGVEVEAPKTLRRLLSHVLRQALAKFRSREINLGITVDEAARESEELGDVFYETWDALLAETGLTGALEICIESELEGRGGQLFARGRRLHALMETSVTSQSTVGFRSWLGGEVLHYNGPLTPVLTDKRTLALLSELAESGLWSAEERKFLRSIVPWTRRVAGWGLDGSAMEGVDPETLVRERERLVLKPGAGLGGKDVILGVFAEPVEWSEAVERAFEEGHWVVQERAVSEPYLYLNPDGPVEHDLVWAFFVFGETYGGGMARMVPRANRGVVNVHQGATIAPILEVDA